MPIRKRWFKFTLENVKKLPIERGAYELASNNKRLIYIGKSDSELSGVRGRLLSHLRTNKYPTATFFRFVDAPLLVKGSSIEALLGNRYDKKHHRKPKYNKRLPHE